MGAGRPTDAGERSGGVRVDPGGGRPQLVFDFTIVDGSIVEIELVADPDRLAQLDLVSLDD